MHQIISYNPPMTEQREITEVDRAAQEFGDLFVMTAAEKEAMLEYERRLMEFRPQQLASFTALARLNKETEDRNTRLAALNKSLEEQTDQIQMSQNIDLFFLAISDYGKAKGWSEAQILDVLQRHMEYTFQVTHIMADTVASKSLTNMLAGQRRKSVEALNGHKSSVPEWFRGSKAQWYAVINELDSVIKAEENKRLGDGERRTIAKKGRFFRVISPDCVPDWYEPNPKAMPDMDVVLEDYLDEEEHKNKILEEFRFVSRQRTEIYEKTQEKGRKTIGRNTRRIQELLPEQTSLAELIMFLADTDGLTYYDLDPSKIDAMSPAQVNAAALEEEAKENKFIADFVRKSGMSPEMVRLFLEKKLAEAKLSEAEAELRGRYIAALLEKDPDSENLAELRALDKKRVQKITYEIKPLLVGLDEECLELLRHEFVGNPFVTEKELAAKLAQFISATPWTESRTKETSRLARDYERFALNWLRSNWRKAYAALYLQLHPKAELVTETPHELDEETNAVDLADEEQRELAESIEEVRLGNLAQWEVYYDVNKNGDGRMETVEAESLLDMEGVLASILQKHRISCSVKLSSIIHTLEWTTAIPQDVLQIMIRERVNGRDYLKIKRGNVRLFFQMDRAAKRLTFFVYQKQSLSYHF